MIPSLPPEFIAAVAALVLTAAAILSLPFGAAVGTAVKAIVVSLFHFSVSLLGS